MHFGRTPGLEIGGGQLDADEIYIDDPRVFLAKVPDRFRTVLPGTRWGYAAFFAGVTGDTDTIS
jgi:hypothetical protein